MIEVFKTNVKDREEAQMLLEQIHDRFIHYKANFDLDDCDRILRVASSNGHIQIDHLIDLVKGSGFHAEVLSDEPPGFKNLFQSIAQSKGRKEENKM